MRLTLGRWIRKINFFWRLVVLLLVLAGVAGRQKAAEQVPYWLFLKIVSQVTGNACRIVKVSSNAGSNYVYLAGDFTRTVRFGTTQLNSAGGTDGFLAK